MNKLCDKNLNERACTNRPSQCVIEALELCLNCNNSIFNNTNYIETDGTDEGPICCARALIWLWQGMKEKP